jgi:hypothetical protein
MPKSRYEQNIVRKPGIRGPDKEASYPDKLDVKGKADTGPMIWWSKEMVKGSKTLLETGIISQDCIVGSGRPGSFSPHKNINLNGEYFMFLGTNPDDPLDLGAVAEFFLGEGPTLEKVVIDHSATVYVPPGLGHFPIVWKNVKRPVMFIVVVPESDENSTMAPVSMVGRPL